jgi:very-short-patch-repair endonuclease
LNGDRAILVDFYLPKQMLAIEIDGGVHAKQRKYDAGRDKWLEETYGARTIRFSNKDVLKANGVVQSQLFKLVTKEVTVLR